MSEVILVVSLNPNPEIRHHEARASWDPLIDSGMLLAALHRPASGRSAQDLGDPRDLPYFKDVLKIGCDVSTAIEGRESDVIMWTNDDVVLDPRVVPWCRSIVRLHRAVSMRRTEPGDNPKNPHMGRELFAFTRKWLDTHLSDFPDFIMGCPFFDLIIAAIIRKSRGIDSTTENLKEDLYPCDSEHRYAIHAPHPSSRAGANEFKFPANNHNRTLAREWCRVNMPSLRL